MSSTAGITSIQLPSLQHLATGKVRELFRLDDNTLLFVSTDRISAYDVVLDNAIPYKGAVLTLTSAHWFKVLSTLIPILKTHVVSLTPPASLSPTERALISNRSMTVRRLKIFPVEAIVRGYISGSAWAEYKAKGTVHSIAVPAGMQQSQKFAEPLFTPSTKAEQGEKDENIHPSEVAALVGGEKYAKRIEELALALYSAAAEYALERGIIIADTKFEFALDEKTDEVVLADEVLTPDSSRFWPADKYEVGRDQDSLDKQFVRNYLVENGLKGKEGVKLPENIVKATEQNYKDVFQRLTGQSFEDALKTTL
ncbi:Bifunctional purine biosynthetic protein ade1 [Ceratocystis pirilliformis]|uniref:Phosphoribosylaminoimidazole-succinocarboxamide synthase n=1 Tax=Ceratocystis pirilliformis TaxID=259994 RepID=A0ABR3YJA2_9PEZI